jgi:ATP-dependent Clp protease adapter protein ClpS
MEAVVAILTSTFAKSHAEAVHLMLTTHHRGSAVVGEFAPDEAETLAARATEQARWRGMPLKVAIEPAGTAERAEPSWVLRAWRKIAG